MTIIELLKQLGVEYRTEGTPHCRPGWVQIDCPYCGRGSHKWHLGININRRYAHCWKCGSKNLFHVLTIVSKVPPSEISHKLKDVEYQLAPFEPKRTGRLALPRGLGLMTRAHRDYLHRRGFNSHQLTTLWGLRGIGLSRDLPWRIFIPIKLNGQTVSWTTRSIGNREPKYISAAIEQEDVPHKSLLYGEDLAGIAVVVVEGPTDVWRIGPGAVATFGTSYSSAQVLRLSHYPVRYIWFDNEPIAQRQAARLASSLSVFAGETHIVRSDAPDPGVADENEINQIREWIKRSA